MNAPSDRPLRRVNLNLYADDVECMISRYGYGWTEQIRLVIRKDCEAYRSLRRTLDEGFTSGEGI